MLGKKKNHLEHNFKHLLYTESLFSETLRNVYFLSIGSEYMPSDVNGHFSLVLETTFQCCTLQLLQVLF